MRYRWASTPTRRRAGSVKPVGEVPFGDEGVAVRAKKFPLPVFAQLDPQMGFVLGGSAGEQRGGNPLVEHQPASEGDPADHGRSP
jgi:hypothetical protein